MRLRRADRRTERPETPARWPAATGAGVATRNMLLKEPRLSTSESHGRAHRRRLYLHDTVGGPTRGHQISGPCRPATVWASPAVVAGLTTLADQQERRRSLAIAQG